MVGRGATQRSPLYGFHCRTRRGLTLLAGADSRGPLVIPRDSGLVKRTKTRWSRCLVRHDRAVGGGHVAGVGVVAWPRGKRRGERDHTDSGKVKRCVPAACASARARCRSCAGGGRTCHACPLGLASRLGCGLLLRLRGCPFPDLKPSFGPFSVPKCNHRPLLSSERE